MLSLTGQGNLCGIIFYKYVVPDGTNEFMCEHDSINMLSLNGTREFMWDHDSINMLSLTGQGNLCGIIFYKYVVPDGTGEFMWDHIL